MRAALGTVVTQIFAVLVLIFAVLAFIASWGGTLLLIVSMIAIVVKAIGVAVPIAWPLIVVMLIGSIVLIYVGGLVGEALRSDAAT